MKDHRQSVVLATKYSLANPGTDPNAAGNQRKNMMQALEASLKRLQTDFIDLYWVHIWDQIASVEEVMRGLDDLIRQGKVHYVGTSYTRSGKAEQLDEGIASELSLRGCVAACSL